MLGASDVIHVVHNGYGASEKYLIFSITLRETAIINYL